MNIFYSDKKIIFDLRSGDKLAVNRALQYLYGNYYELCLKIVRLNRGNEYEAADVFQDALISFYESVLKKKFRGDSSIKTYLYSTVRNLWLTKLGKNRMMVNMEDCQNKKKSLITEKQNFTEDQPEYLLEEIIDKTGKQCKKILKHYYYENRSMKEITQLMGFSNENSAKTQKYKCMKKLILFLDKHQKLKNSLLELNSYN